MTERDDHSAGLEIPDLELEPAVPKRPEPRAPLSGPSAASARGALTGATFGGDDDDDFELVPTGAKLELSGGPLQPAPGLDPQRAATAAWPSGRTRPAEQLPVDPLEVALVAGYGAAPRSAVLAPLYAYRVYTRRRALERAIAEHHAALQREEAERDALLAQLANELRPTLEANEAFRRMLEPVREVERLAGDRHAAFSQADAGYREQMASFDQDLARLGEAAAQAQALVARCSTAAEVTEAALRRAEAKHKRVQIEIRGVMDLARQKLGPAGGDMPAPQAAQLAELQARSQALQPELDQARAAHAASSAELERAQAELKRLEGQTRQVQRQKASASGGLEQQLSQRAAGVSDAEKQRRDALADVARAVLASRGSVPVAEPTLQALRAHDARVDAQALRLETQLRALDSHDHERVRQGVILVLSVLGLVVLAITIKAML